MYTVAWGLKSLWKVVSLGSFFFFFFLHSCNIDFSRPYDVCYWLVKAPVSTIFQTTTQNLAKRGYNTGNCINNHEHFHYSRFTWEKIYLMLVPCVGDGWLSSLDDHQFPHVLKAGVRGHQAVEWGLIIKRSSCNRYTHTHTHTHTWVIEWSHKRFHNKGSMVRSVCTQWNAGTLYSKPMK